MGWCEGLLGLLVGFISGSLPLWLKLLFISLMYLALILLWLLCQGCIGTYIHFIKVSFVWKLSHPYSSCVLKIWQDIAYTSYLRFFLSRCSNQKGSTPFIASFMTPLAGSTPVTKKRCWKWFIEFYIHCASPYISFRCILRVEFWMSLFWNQTMACIDLASLVELIL